MNKQIQEPVAWLVYVKGATGKEYRENVFLSEPEAKECARFLGEEFLRIDALYATPSKDRVDAERFEAMDDALEKIRQWARAYPLQAFPEPDLEKAHEALATVGITLDAVSASAMRHVITEVAKIAAIRDSKQ